MPELTMRRAEFLMVLAYASDLATGHSRDFALKSCILAMRLADLAGLALEDRRGVYHQALLRYVGCNAETHLLAAAFGDEIALRKDLAGLDMGDRSEVARVFVNAFKRLFYDLEPALQARAVEKGLSEAIQTSIPILTAHCEVAQRIGERLGLAPDLRKNLGQIYERWDGRGLPRGLAAEDVTLAVRVVTLAQDAIALAEAHGPEAAAGIVASRGGGPYEADLADLFAANAAGLLDGIGETVSRAEVLALEPEPHEILDRDACEAACLAVADMIDMRMPFLYGHSRAVAGLAAAAAEHMGLPASDVRALRWAGYMHDIGELVVPVATWMREGPLSAREVDAAHLHPYYGERALASLGSAGEPVAELVVRHHECLDRTGYHRRVDGSDLSPAARILAAAEAFETAREARPHRIALSDGAAANKLRTLAREGRLCPDGVEAVLKVAGQPSRRAAKTYLAGMTPREIEVLRLIAAGLTAKEVARELDISPKTSDNHIQSLYSKIGVTTRAGAALYAVEHGLLQRGAIAA